MPVNQHAATAVDGWIARLGRILLPPRCLACGEAGADGRDLCAACQRALPWNAASCARCGLPMAEAVDACGRCLRTPPPLDRVHAAFDYRFPVDRLIPRFKFHHDLAAGRELALAMRTSLAGRALASGSPDAVVPVPLHAHRLRERGYNQALELARPLAAAFGLPLLADGLRRTRETAPQSGLSALARRRNPRGAFAAGPAALPAHVVLVDDVMTTGATLFACARALRQAGVQRVDAWVAARVPPQSLRAP